MKRLRLLILVFILALAVPLGYLVFRTHRSLEQEETAELRFFANTLFDRMEDDLAALVQREEQRPVEDYLPSAAPEHSGPRETLRSTLAQPAAESYIMGYLQNNPDGSFSTPGAEGGGAGPGDRAALVARLEDVNRIFNTKRAVQPEISDHKAAEAAPKSSLAEHGDVEGKKVNSSAKKDERIGFAEKYLDVSRSSKEKAYLGQSAKRVEQISPQQAMNLAQSDEQQPARRQSTNMARLAERQEEANGQVGAWGTAMSPAESAPSVSSLLPPRSAQPQPVRRFSAEDALRVEVDPMQSIAIDNDRVMLFRRIVIGNQVYRQGLVIRVGELLNRLKEAHFSAQPMAGFTNLTLTAVTGGVETARVQQGPRVGHPRFALERVFPRPFAFIRASLACENIPRSPGRATLHVMVGVLALVILLGLLAIYHSARMVTDLSERRSGFVSSVTHELKTPLTNIRMYIEMLEHGIASDPEREMEYYRILGSESARLSRLINNVLEFSKLERRQRRLDLREGSLAEVFDEVRDAMQERLRQEGFTLTVENPLDQPFRYDREVMVQVLINLIENSVKFGKGTLRREITVLVRREANRVVIRVSDTGPGIPRHALKRIFDDFYRVDNDLTRSTKGTGIGLALVRRFVEAMGGAVSAANNDGAGCTITISLPGTVC